mgnify:CR=1 FL=1
MPKIVLFPLDSEQFYETDYTEPLNAYPSNVYSHWRSRTEGRGLYNTINGELDLDNLISNFSIGKQHVMPEQAALSRTESMRESCTIFGRSSDNSVKNSSEGDYFNVPGLSLRWYQPYDASAGIAQWSFFLSWNNWMARFRDMVYQNWGQGVFTELSFRCTLDGSVISGTNRRVGENFFHPVSPGGPNPFVDYDGPGMDVFAGADGKEYTEDGMDMAAGNPRYCFPEAHSASHFDMHHQLQSGDLTKGYHEISVQCSIRTCKDANGDKPSPVFLQNTGKEVVAKDKHSQRYRLRGHFNLIGKVSFGMRNARVVSFL